MKEAYLLMKSRTQDYLMTVDNYQQSLEKVVNKLNQYKEDYVNLYLNCNDIEKSQRSLLIKLIAEYLFKYSKNRVNLHLVIDKDYIDEQEYVITFVYYMIEKYKKIDNLDIILNIIIDGNDIKEDHIKFAKLISHIHSRFVRMWVHVKEDNLNDLSEILYKLSFNGLLNSSLITLDINLKKDISCELKQVVRNIPREALIYLVESYLDETSDWLTRFEKKCFDANGEILETCLNSEDCILIRKNNSKLRMIPLLKEIVYSLQGKSISSEGGFGIKCGECDNSSCPCNHEKQK